MERYHQLYKWYGLAILLNYTAVIGLLWVLRSYLSPCLLVEGWGRQHCPYSNPGPQDLTITPVRPAAAAASTTVAVHTSVLTATTRYIFLTVYRWLHHRTPWFTRPPKVRSVRRHWLLWIALPASESPRNTIVYCCARVPRSILTSPKSSVHSVREGLLSPSYII